MSKEQIKDKIENLTREQKERLVREYVRRKITKILAEDKNAKPDYIDLDDDGDKEEPMKKAAADKKEKEQLKDSIVKEQEGEEEVQKLKNSKTSCRRRRGDPDQNKQLQKNQLAEDSAKETKQIYKIKITKLW